MKPGNSTLFVLDDQGDMDVILHSISGPRRDDSQDESGPGESEADPVRADRRPGRSNPNRPPVDRIRDGRGHHHTETYAE